MLLVHQFKTTFDAIKTLVEAVDTTTHGSRLFFELPESLFYFAHVVLQTFDATANLAQVLKDDIFDVSHRRFPRKSGFSTAFAEYR